MKYSESKSILDQMKSTFVPGVTFDNKNIGGSTVHTVTENDRLAMFGIMDYMKMSQTNFFTIIIHKPLNQNKMKGN